ncbi:MAG: Pr6Pr family membrane protein [Clostridia bacterium]|nr:Pr6Pr family membrane protein [Clostridia bacterium]
MKKNLLTKVLYRTVFCTVSFFAILLMTEFFSVGGEDYAHFTPDFFYYYTNLSNFLCFGVMIACLHGDVKQLRAGRETWYNQNPFLKHLKFAATLIIAITFIAYGLLLGEPGSISFWNNIANLCYHVAVPVLFIVDTVLFDEHKSIGYLDPVLAMVLPLIYVIVIEIMGAHTGRYPYFFLDMATLGLGGLLRWIAILLGLFVRLGYLLFFYDKLVKTDGRWRLDLSGTSALGAAKETAALRK